MQIHANREAIDICFNRKRLRILQIVYVSNYEILRQIERKIILNASAPFKLDRVPRIPIMMDMNATHITLYDDIFIPVVSLKRNMRFVILSLLKCLIF